MYTHIYIYTLPAFTYTRTYTNICISVYITNIENSLMDITYGLALVPPQTLKVQLHGTPQHEASSSCGNKDVFLLNRVCMKPS